ncbi:hypothetical protein GCM10023115_40250 [Pontixanthobacter gangjinensis]
MVLAGCSGDDVINSQKEDQSKIDPNSPAVLTEDGYGIHFLTTISNYFARDLGTFVYRGASLNGTWEHEYDNDDRLFKSTYYENYPKRILKEIIYSNYSSDNLEMDIRVKTNYYSYWFTTTYNQNFRLVLHGDFSADRLIRDHGDGHLSFDELTQDGFVTKMGDFTGSGSKLWTTNYEYDEEGNATKYYTTYHQYYIEDASVDYSYTSFGDPYSYYFHNELGAFSEVKYHYRQDKTLEKLEETFDWGDGDAGTKLVIFNESEALESELIKYEDGSTFSKAFESDMIIEKYYRPGDILRKVIRYRVSENHIWCEQVEYYDEEGNLEYTEFYNQNGDLVETIYE